VGWPQRTLQATADGGASAFINKLRGRRHRLTAPGASKSEVGGRGIPGRGRRHKVVGVEHI